MTLMNYSKYCISMRFIIDFINEYQIIMEQIFVLNNYNADQIILIDKLYLLIQALLCWQIQRVDYFY